MPRDTRHHAQMRRCACPAPPLQPWCAQKKGKAASAGAQEWAREDESRTQPRERPTIRAAHYMILSNPRAFPDCRGGSSSGGTLAGRERRWGFLCLLCRWRLLRLPRCGGTPWGCSLAVLRYRNVAACRRVGALLRSHVRSTALLLFEPLAQPLALPSLFLVHGVGHVLYRALVVLVHLL